MKFTTPIFKQKYMLLHAVPRHRIVSKSIHSSFLAVLLTRKQTNKWKKRSEATQTLRTGCSKEPKKFAPPQTPLIPRGAGRPKFNQLTNVITLPLPTDPVWWGSMHAISSYRGNRPTNTQTQTQTGPIYSPMRRS